jgi:hypothetical protein
MTWDTFWLVVATNLFTLGLSTMLYVVRVDELRRDQQQLINQLNLDMQKQSRMFRGDA